VDGFVFDEGPHVSFTSRPEIQSLLAQAVDGQFLEQDTRLLNYWKGHWVRHPAQCNLYGLPVDVVERCVIDFVKARYEDQRPIKTYADWCYKGLGRAFSEDFTFGYTRKYWTTEASNMSTDWLGPRMYAPHLEEVVRGALGSQRDSHHYITRFRYPRQGGFGAYVRAVTTDQSVHLDREVVVVDLVQRKLEFASGEQDHFEALISSLPLPELIRCIKDVPKPVAEAAQQLTCTSLVTVNVGIARNEGFPDAHWMYFYDEDIIFARGSFPHRLSPDNVPAGCASIQVEVYYSKYRPLSCNDVLNRVLEDLHRIGLLQKDDRILVAQEQHIPYGNVLFDLERARNLAIVQTYLEEQEIVCCGRYGEWAYYWSDDSIVSGWRAAERVIERHRAK
jgi:protoporphyrinogen oxidase